MVAGNSEEMLQNNRLHTRVPRSRLISHWACLPRKGLTRIHRCGRRAGRAYFCPNAQPRMSQSGWHSAFTIAHRRISQTLERQDPLSTLGSRGCERVKLGASRARCTSGSYMAPLKLYLTRFATEGPQVLSTFGQLSMEQ